jgi:hypothetical protein
MNILIQVYFAALTSVKPTGLPKVEANQSSLSDILQIFFGVIGALAVLMIVISGLRYVLAGGDSQRAAQAKSGIVYALVGLAIAISAQAIVYFVVSRL